MSIITTIKAINSIRQSSNFIKQQETLKNKVRYMIDRLQKAVVFLLEKKAVIDRFIAQAETDIQKLKEFLHK